MKAGTDLFLGDSKEVLKKLPDNSVDLIITSLPYADPRKEMDTVLDPFVGSGVTIQVANRMKRHSIGIDIIPEYYNAVKEWVPAIESYIPKPV